MKFDHPKTRLLMVAIAMNSHLLNFKGHLSSTLVMIWRQSDTVSTEIRAAIGENKLLQQSSAKCLQLAANM